MRVFSKSVPHQNQSENQTLLLTSLKKPGPTPPKSKNQYLKGFLYTMFYLKETPHLERIKLWISVL